MPWLAVAAPYIAGALAVAGAGYSAYSSVQQGKATEKLNNYNAQLAEQNANTAQRDASIQANAVRQRNAFLAARQRTAYAKAGVVGDTGSPLTVEAEQAGYLEMGALDTQRTGDIQAANLRQQATLDRMSGKIARTAGNMNATASILQGTASAASIAGRASYNGSGSGVTNRTANYIA